MRHEKHQFENKVNDASSVFCGHWLTYSSSVQIFSWRQRQKKKKKKGHFIIYLHEL